MSSTLAVPPRPSSPARPERFTKLPAFFDALGGIPLDRIVMNPLPGTATVQDCLEYGERVAAAELVDNTIVEKKMGLLGGDHRHASCGTDLNLHKPESAQARRASSTAQPPRCVSPPATSACRTSPTWSASGPRRATSRCPSSRPTSSSKILSDSNTPREIDRKLSEFFAGGTRLAWVIDRRKQIVTIYHGNLDNPATLTIDDHLDGEDILPGFTLPVAKLFDGIPTA